MRIGWLKTLMKLTSQVAVFPVATSEGEMATLAQHCVCVGALRGRVRVLIRQASGLKCRRRCKGVESQ
jgi:F0F1-type ATP synthase epsilon subunit